MQYYEPNQEPDAIDDCTPPSAGVAEEEMAGQNETPPGSSLRKSGAVPKEIWTGDDGPDSETDESSEDEGETGQVSTNLPNMFPEENEPFIALPIWAWLGFECEEELEVAKEEWMKCGCDMCRVCLADVGGLPSA